MNIEKGSEININTDQIRKNAAKSLGCGAVTDDYPLDLDVACKLLNEALASEILCVLRYRHHQITAKGNSDSQKNVSDQDLHKNIRSALSSGWFSKGFEQVSFEVSNGNVVLKGSVNALNDKNKVEEKSC